ncbi:MAG: TrkH family potassium uptake protein [Acidobacteriota bacterium]|nr:TrkH family potassium uptake protein [Acidobacteriota bacterium]
MDLKIVGLLAGLMGVFLLFPLALALARDEPATPFIRGMALAFFLAAAGVVVGFRSGQTIQTRDGFLVVTAGWLVASTVAAVPYLASGSLGTVDAWFEAVSGITTTGSTILTDIEALPRSLLLWRSMTQWLGGMGIILFTIAVLPLLGVGGMQLFKAEVPGPVADKLTPRLAVTARYLWYVYVGLTAAEFLLLWILGMPWLDAIDHSLTTLATGGFSPRNESIAAYTSPAIRLVIMLFMFLAGTNFVLHFRLLAGRWRTIVSDDEWRWYVMLIAGFATIFTTFLVYQGTGLYRAAEDSLFTVISLMTTTGYATADFETWPLALQGLLGLTLVFGGMAGSTGGGVKTLRTLMAFRSLRMSFRKMLHPHAMTPVVYRGKLVPPDVMNAIWGFFAAYLILAVIGMLLINLSGADMVTAWTASLTAVSNVGPGLGQVGPTDNFAWLPGYAKIALTFLMLSGRLELYTVILVFLPGFWRR